MVKAVLEICLFFFARCCDRNFLKEIQMFSEAFRFESLDIRCEIFICLQPNLYRSDGHKDRVALPNKFNKEMNLVSGNIKTPSQGQEETVS